ncbi:MAG TPA: hypothetical protein VJR29_05600 [bacterium]|nr:hypothetical protein [bacterium]
MAAFFFLISLFSVPVSAETVKGQSGLLLPSQQELLKQVVGKTPRKYLGQMDLSDPGPVSVEGNFSYLEFSGDVRGRILLLSLDTGVLAYLQTKPTVKLLDLVGIAQDRHVSFSPETGLYSNGRGELLFWTSHSHHNAGESYQIYNLLLAGAERIELVYDGPFLYSFLLYDSDCRVAQSLAPVPEASAGAEGFPKLAMRVRQEKLCSKSGKEVRRGERRFEAALTWDPARRQYMGGSKELFRLNHCRIEGKGKCE